MAKVTYKAICSCGREAIITKTVDGQAVHKCFVCLAKPASLRERDNKMLRKLGLIT